jgi:hypothetical protein
MMGTASNIIRGLFYDITTGKEPGWKLYQWTAFDNPYVAKQWAELLEEIRTTRPLYMNTPQYKQWYLNQWVVDEEKLVYRFNPVLNLVKELPRLPYDGWARGLGMDTGWEDDNAFIRGQYHVNDPHFYITNQFCKNKMTFDQVADKCLEYMADTMNAPQKFIIDGANKQGVESMRARSAIPFEYADKQDKATFIELCNADLVQGKIKFLDTPEIKPLLDEMMALVWVCEGDKIKLPKKENPNLPNHRTDAFLYLWRNGYHYHSQPAKKTFIKGSKEWYLAQSENIWEREREKLERDSSEGDWAPMTQDWGDFQ